MFNYLSQFTIMLSNVHDNDLSHLKNINLWAPIPRLDITSLIQRDVNNFNQDGYEYKWSSVNNYLGDINGI